MIVKTRSLMRLLRELSDVYAAYDRGRTDRLEAELRARQLLDRIATVLGDPPVRDALDDLASRTDTAVLPQREDVQALEDLVSVEVSVTNGFGFTRADLRVLLRVAVRRADDGDRIAQAEGHPADMLREKLSVLHDLQMDQLSAAKRLGRTKKRTRKKLLRKGLAKIVGGIAVMVADATLVAAAPVAPASFVAGGLAVAAGMDDYAVG